jgi:hypothetical protein
MGIHNPIPYLDNPTKNKIGTRMGKFFYNYTPCPYPTK